jgi:hypothetical protein
MSNYKKVRMAPPPRRKRLKELKDRARKTLKPNSSGKPARALRAGLYSA